MRESFSWIQLWKVKNIGVNNAFGSIAFVGDTEQFGEQWLYSRPAFSLISELYEKSLNYAVLHIPKYSDSDIELNVSKAGSRFAASDRRGAIKSRLPIL